MNTGRNHIYISMLYKRMLMNGEGASVWRYLHMQDFLIAIFWQTGFFTGFCSIAANMLENGEFLSLLTIQSNIIRNSIYIFPFFHVLSSSGIVLFSMFCVSMFPLVNIKIWNKKIAETLNNLYILTFCRKLS